MGLQMLQPTDSKSHQNDYKIPLGHVLKHVSKGPDTYGVLTATPVSLACARLAVTVITSLGFPVILMSGVRHLADSQRTSRHIMSVTLSPFL